MDKPNVFRSSNFYMGQGDVLHIIISDESGVQVSIELYGASTTPEATQWGDLKDYDGNIYTEVIIGTQRWIVENLRVTHYADGTLIPEVTLNANWILEDGTAGHDGAWCYYNNDPANLADYGLLYNGWAATNGKNLAYFERDGVQELGWGVPTDTDYEALSTYLGGRFVAGGKLKEIGLTHWTTPNAGVTNETGFSAVGSGERLSTGVFSNFNDKNSLWTSPLADPGGTAYYCYLRYNQIDFTTPQYISDISCKFGFSVRCVKDEAETYVYDYDNNQYQVITIGTQQWILENLKTTHYGDGTLIANIIDSQYTDWYLPSKDELNAMYVELCAFGVGNFSIFVYCSSSESSATGVWAQNFLNGVQSNIDPGKANTYFVRACREFTSSTVLSLRDSGEAGGLIFNIVDNGDGTYTYLEAATTDHSVSYVWSNIINVAIGTTGTAIGTGQANTTAIIGQAGHITSAAKLCNDLTYGGWINDTVGAYCWYDNDIGYKNFYGALYNWYAVDNAHELAYLTNSVGVRQDGWKVPTKADMETLNTYLGGEPTAGGKLKDTGFTYWNAPNTGATNESGFTALGSGEREDAGIFNNILEQGNLWESTEYSATDGDATIMVWSAVDNSYQNLPKFWGVSVRLVRNI